MILVYAKNKVVHKKILEIFLEKIYRIFQKEEFTKESLDIFEENLETFSNENEEFPKKSADGNREGISQISNWTLQDKFFDNVIFHVVKILVFSLQ